jgi:hypothetical protein
MTLRVLASLLLSLTGLIGTGAAHAQSPESVAFHARIGSLYGFHPHTLDSKGLKSKSDELDQFWTEAKAQKESVLPLLRQELADTRNPSFFFFDGAQLLLSLSQDRADLALALNAVPRVDLQDVQGGEYVKTVQRLAAKGLDTREAAFRILTSPKFVAIIPQHALTLGQNYSLIYMLYPMEAVDFEPDLIAQLDREQDPGTQKSLLLALWYRCTPGSRAALEGFAKKPGVSAEVVSYVREMLQRPLASGISVSAANAIRLERAKVMQRPVSDEALYDFDKLTVKLLAKP